MPEVMAEISESADGHSGPATQGLAHSSRNGLLCALLFAAGWLIVQPFADMPFIDDFSYAKTALDFSRTGRFAYNGWATAMLGWLVPWGALFIKVFGFSFNVLHISMLPIAMGTVYLFHQVLRRFGVNPSNAVLGALTLGFWPEFLWLSGSYMTDVPGLFVIVVCIHMCQRAVDARTDRAALIWLCSAMLVNIAGGTVRQIAWLGALIMVPSTAWFLRKRHGMRAAGVVLFLCSFVSVVACMQWFKAQPYSLPDYLLVQPIDVRMLVHLGDQLVKVSMSLLRLSLPISIALLTLIRRFSRRERLRLFVIFAVFCIGVIALDWDEYGQILLLATSITLLALLPVAVLIQHAIARMRIGRYLTHTRLTGWMKVVAILGPFSLAYLFLLLPSGIYYAIYQRYAFGLFPIAIVGFLCLNERYTKGSISVLSVVAIAIMAGYGISSSHDFFATSRATASALQVLEDSGIPRIAVQVNIPVIGLASNGWAQIEAGGYINDPRIKTPPGAYNPNTQDSSASRDCASWVSPMTPVIHPKYFVEAVKRPCLVSAVYPPMNYTAWLPPFHRSLYIQQFASK